MTTAPLTALPATIDWPAFDALHDDLPRWRDLIVDLAVRHAGARADGSDVVAMASGTVLVALIGRERVIKLYPPFLRDHFAFERGLMPRLHGRLALPTPALLAEGECDGWPWLVMGQLAGEPLERHWPALGEDARCAIVQALGALARQVHALPVGGMAALAPPWGEFLARQRAGCHGRQQRTGLPAHLLAQLDAFLDGPLPIAPGEPDVLLTGEYSPMNLLVQGERLSGMFDFGDGLVGPAAYDWLGPLCFLAAGSRRAVDAYFEGYGVQRDPGWRAPLLRMLLLHKYSSLRMQLAGVPAWRDAATFDDLARCIWP